MSTTSPMQHACGCGTASRDDDTRDDDAVAEPCRCGCCGTRPGPTRERIEELRRIRASLDRELAELEG